MSKKGLTLIEILVSSILIALVLAGLVSLFVANKRMIQHSRFRMAGGEVGKVFLSPLQAQVRQDQWSTNNLGNRTNWTATHAIDNVAYSATYNITNHTNTGLIRKVRVSISWNETGQ
jgi:Tfp pilus assembly protein PilW